VVANNPSPPLPWWVRGIHCSPGPRRPHFYMWTAVNATEWHTTKVGCAAALSLLNGTLAFSLTRVSGTHTSQGSAPTKMCAGECVCVRVRPIATLRIFVICSQAWELRKGLCVCLCVFVCVFVWEREREWKKGRMIRHRGAREQIHMHVTFHRKTIYILSPYYVNFEWPLQIILLRR